MSFRIGPSRCSECGDDYGHTKDCSRNSDRPENWPVSKQLEALSKSPASVSEKDRLTRLIKILTALAHQVEDRY